MHGCKKPPDKSTMETIVVLLTKYIKKLTLNFIHFAHNRYKHRNPNSKK